MRNEGLKDKLDKRPVYFDREALWNRIESEQESKNRIYIWWLFLGIMILVGLVVVIHNFSISNVLSQDVLVSQEAENIEELDLLVSNESTTKEDIKGSHINMLSSKKKEVGEILNGGQSGLSIPSNNEGVDGTYSIFSDTFSNNRAIDQESIANISYSKNSVEKNTAVDLQSKNWSNGQVASEKEIPNDVLNRGVKPVPFEKRRKVKSIYSEELKLQDLLDVEVLNKSKEENEFLNGFDIYLGLGSDRHHFNGDAEYRRSELELNLESITANVSYVRYFKSRWSVSLGLGYTSSQTKINLTSLDIDQYHRSIQDGSTTITTTETVRKLYNRYSRMESSITLGYSWYFKKWIFSTRLGKGINLRLDVEGDVINQENEVFSFDEIGIYEDRLNGYWITGIQLGRRLSTKWKIGLNASLQSSRNLSSSDHQHSINPISTGVFFEWLW